METYQCLDHKLGKHCFYLLLFLQKLLYIIIDRIGNDDVHLLGWNVPAHELHTIPEHWLTHVEPQASLHYLLGLLYVAFTIVALTGNGLVIWVFSS